MARSGRSGWSHLYLYDDDGHLLAQLTAGDFPVLDVVAVDEDGGWVYCGARADDDVIADRWVAFAAHCSGNAQGYRMIKIAVVTNFSGFSDDNTHSMINYQAATEFGGRTGKDRIGRAATVSGLQRAGDQDGRSPEGHEHQQQEQRQEGVELRYQRYGHGVAHQAQADCRAQPDPAEHETG